MVTTMVARWVRLNAPRLALAAWVRSSRHRPECEFDGGGLAGHPDTAETIAEVKFTRVLDSVIMTLFIDGTAIAGSPYHALIAQQLRIRGIQSIRLDGDLIIELPTNLQTLIIATDHDFKEKMDVFRLIVACNNDNDERAD